MWDQMLLGIQTAFTLQNMLFAGKEHILESESCLDP